MKKLLFLFFTIFLVSFSYAQSFSDIKLEAGSDYAGAEPEVLKAANYLFTTKFDPDDLERLYATELVMKWMAGTPEYTFEISEKFAKPFLKENELMNLYMAAMAKFALENKDKASDANAVGFNAVKAVIEYSNKSANNIRQTSEIKKMAAALKKGELEKYLGI